MRQRSYGEFERQTSKRSVPNWEFALTILVVGPYQDIVFTYDRIPLWRRFPCFLCEIICAVWYTNQRELFCRYYFHKVSRNLLQRFHSAVNITFTTCRCRTNITPGFILKRFSIAGIRCQIVLVDTYECLDWFLFGISVGFVFLDPFALPVYDKPEVSLHSCR